MTDAPPTKNAELLPCPFCGSEAIFSETQYSSRSLYAVDCKNDDCQIGTDLPDEAIAAWNRRAYPPPSGEVAEQISAGRKPDIRANREWLRAHRSEYPVTQWLAVKDGELLAQTDSLDQFEALGIQVLNSGILFTRGSKPGDKPPLSGEVASLIADWRVITDEDAAWCFAKDHFSTLCDALEQSARATQPGSWAWALEQMKAGRTVFHGNSPRLREQEVGGGYYLAFDQERSWFWQPISEDFEATDWQLVDDSK